VPPQRPDLRAIPRSDREFQRAVDRLATEWLATIGDGPADPAAFQKYLQTEFPSANVRSQEPLATLGVSQLVWYVQRRDVGPTSASREANGPEMGGGPTYSVARVAQMAGIPITVLVSWDEVEGLIRPYRSPGGQVLYSRDDLEAVLIAKRGFVAGKSAEQVRADLAAPKSTDRVPSEPRPIGRRLLVLLAERDRYAAEFSEYFLRTEGYDVEVALTSEEAEATAIALQPELAVVELLISGGAGAELCARLKATTGAAVLAISNLDARDAALRAGADAFLAKPYDALAFVSVVKDLLGESAMVRQSGGVESPARGGA
jgi:CheY-like chemotaxis protein